MSNDILDRAEAALDGVTEGPWRASLLGDGIDYDDGSSCYRGGVYPADHGSTPIFLAAGGIDRRDARFIAEARALVPELTDEIERLRAQLPRRIETVEQLDALPVGAIIKVGPWLGGIYEKDRDNSWGYDGGEDGALLISDVGGREAITVLYTPEVGDE